MQNSATERSFQPRKAGKVSESHKVTQGIRKIFIKAFERQKTLNDIFTGPHVDLLNTRNGVTTLLEPGSSSSLSALKASFGVPLLLFYCSTMAQSHTSPGSLTSGRPSFLVK